MRGKSQSAELKRLAGMIQAVEARSPSKDAMRRLVSTGWTGADRLVGGVVHEWFGVEGMVCADSRDRWVPPLGIVTHLAWRALESKVDELDDVDVGGVVWIGRRIWPHGRWLVRGCGGTGGGISGISGSTGDGTGCDDGDDRRLLERSLLVDPPRQDGRLWAIDLAVRCPAAVAVVADGSRLDMAGTRRLQLAAEAGSALLLLVRPPWEIERRSAAATRWCVRRVHSTTGAPRWDVKLVRCKGVHAGHLERSIAASGRRTLALPDPAVSSGHKETLEWDREQGAVVTSPEVVDRSDPPARAIPA